MRFRSGDFEDAREASDFSALACEDVSRTRQSDAKQADINFIVEQFGVTGKLPLAPLPPALASFDEVFDFQSAQNVIRAAQESFMALDAKVRSRFENDPELFVNFVDAALAAKQFKELRDMGLAVAEEILEPAAPEAPKA